jgi:predicted RNase H-like HicB family nuclease
MSTYRIVYQRDEDGSWLASVPRVPSAHTYGRTIDQARERIREALGLWVEDAANAKLLDDIQLPSSARATVREWTESKLAAEAADKRAKQRAARAAWALKQNFDFSYADIGKVMGVTRQRAHQIAAGQVVAGKAGRVYKTSFKRAAKRARRAG